MTEALDWMEDASINRARFCLTYVSNRSVGNNPPSGGINHTVFKKNEANFLSTNIDFERFDLSQWSTIDTVIASLAGRGIDAVVVLAMNTLALDYEEQYLDDRGGLGSGTFSPISMSSAAFSNRHEFYLWYVVGRLGAYTNVEWCTGHEWNVDNGSGSPGPYTVATMHGIGSALAAIDPYLSYEPNSKIVNTVPRRGTFYSLASGSFHGSLADNENPFLGSTYDNWRSCIGLQRGGELGITSIVPMVGTAGIDSAPLGYPCTTSVTAHRIGLANSRPILIEEDWISRNDVEDENSGPQPGVAGNFTTPDNPYARYIGVLPNAVDSVTNTNAFEFIPNNFSGLRKSIRDHAWMCGVICQAYTSYWTRKYNLLSEDISTTSWAPYTAIKQHWTDNLEWWRFLYDRDLVIAQSVLVQLHPDEATPAYFGTGSWPGCTQPSLPGRLSSGFDSDGRPPFEQLAIGCKSDHGSTDTQYVIYCPVGGTVSTVTVNLAELGNGASFNYYFVSPDTGSSSSNYSSSVPATGPTTVTFPTPPNAEQQGEHGEYVLFINCPYL